MRTLTELHDCDDLILTAHRGASYYGPENTLPAFRTAIENKADFIEFDLRMSADGVPVILHDETINRTSNGTGKPEEHTLADLKQYNYSWYCQGKRLEAPMLEYNPITTFEEVLKEFRNQACMNIQCYADKTGMNEICRLYLDYDMCDRGYLTIEDIDIVHQVQAYSKNIQICYTPGWYERCKPENLEICAKLGCRFAQPVFEASTAETFATCKKLGIRPVVYFSDSVEKIKEMQAIGMNGVMTNMIETIAPAFK